MPASPRAATLVRVLSDVEGGARAAVDTIAPEENDGIMVDSFHLTWEGPGVRWSADLWTLDRRHFRERGSSPALALKRLARSVRLGREFREPVALATLEGT